MLDMCDVQPSQRVNADHSYHTPPAEPAWSIPLFMEPTHQLINRRSCRAAAFAGK
jgi:hypothetical protein